MEDNIILLENQKTNLNNSVKSFFKATDIDALEFYKFDILLRIEYLFKVKFSQITGYSVNNQIKDDLKERRTNNERV